jgi:hypothetical protein
VTTTGTEPADGTREPPPRPSRPRLSSGAIQRLDIALRVVPFADVAHNTDLRDAVRDQVRHLRSQGQPPERVIIEMKRELADSLKRTSGAAAAAGATVFGEEQGLRAVVDQVVRWSIETYYRGD